MDSIYEAAAKRGLAKGIVGALSESLQRQSNPLVEAFDRVCEEAVLEGFAMGFAKGKAEALSDALHHKFGPLPCQYWGWVETAAPQEIKRWLQRSYDETSIDLVFDGYGEG